MRPASPTLTPQELTLMKVVWTLETATVRDVYEHLRSQRTIAYTTVLTMMKILEQKGYVKKTREERAFVYRPARPRQRRGGGMTGPNLVAYAVQVAIIVLVCAGLPRLLGLRSPGVQYAFWRTL